MYREGGRNWLIPGGNGYVRPLAAAGSMAGGGGDQYFSTSITVRGDVNTRTARQIAVERGFHMRREAGRG